MEVVSSVRSAEPQKVLSRISTFCSQGNFLECLHFLDQELSVFGYPKVCCEGHVDQVTLVNITHDLVHTYRHSLQKCSDTHDFLKNAESETARLQHLLSYSKEDLASKARELKTKSLEESHLNQRVETLKKKLKSEQERCRRLTADMVSRDTQFKHEKKKTNQEIEKLQAKLHQLLQDKRQERMVGIDILNSLQRTDGKRGRWNTDKSKKNSEQDMYRLIITNYEDTQKQLLKENAEMRGYLKQMQNELITALNEKPPTTERSCLSESGDNTSQPCGRTDAIQDDVFTDPDGSPEAPDNHPMSEGVFDMPYAIVQADIENSISSKWKALKKEFTKEKKQTVEKNKWQEKMNGYERMIEEQQRVIDYLTTNQGNEPPDNPHLKNSYFLEEEAELEKKRNLFEQERAAFEQERKTYTEALLELGRDRESFEREKGLWMTKKFMQLTPLRGGERKQKSSSPVAAHLSKNGCLSSSWNGSPSKRCLNWSDGESGDIDKSDSPSMTPHGLNETYLARTIPVDAHSSDSQARSSQASRESSSPLTPPTRRTAALRSSSSTSMPSSPSTVDLYRVLGIRHRDKENADDNCARMDVESSRKSTSKRHYAGDDITNSERKRSGRHHAQKKEVKAALFQS